MEVLLSSKIELPTMGSDPFSDKTVVPLWISWTSRAVYAVSGCTYNERFMNSVLKGHTSLKHSSHLGFVFERDEFQHPVVGISTAE